MRRIEILPRANCHKRSLWAEFIFALDSWLQRREGVFEYATSDLTGSKLKEFADQVVAMKCLEQQTGLSVADQQRWLALSAQLGVKRDQANQSARSFAQKIVELRFWNSELRQRLMQVMPIEEAETFINDLLNVTLTPQAAQVTVTSQAPRVVVLDRSVLTG